MNSFIYTEDLVANALIESIDRKHERRIPISDLQKYGDRLESWWRRNRHIDVTVLSSVPYVSEMLRVYADFFEPWTDRKGGQCVGLRDGKTVDDLRRTFRSYLTEDMRTSFVQSFAA